MAQAQPCERDLHLASDSGSPAKDASSFKFNAQAPEFVPRSSSSSSQHQIQPPSPLQLPDLSAYYYPCFQFFGGGDAAGAGSSDWLLFGDASDPGFLIHGMASGGTSPGASRNVLCDDLQQKIIKQAEYLFSDMSLLANDTLSKHISKDPEGYIPISAIASMKKIKSLTTDIHLLARAIRFSSKLVVSSDGKRVKRKHPFTEKDREELQYRTVVVENLPEDHSHQNMEKIFSVVGRVKNIRICHPQESNISRLRSDYFISNKLHALVEYENTDTAELAVEKLNDERNWRKGLRVRLPMKRTPKSVLKGRRSEFDCFLDDDDGVDSGDDFHPGENAIESNAEDNANGLKKGWGARGRGKARGRVLSHAGSGGCGIGVHNEPHTKLPVKGPRMPDGTRGFTMGRGKPATSPE